MLQLRFSEDVIVIEQQCNVFEHKILIQKIAFFRLTLVNFIVVLKSTSYMPSP